MNKKIREAMRQAEKMDSIREEQNRRYQKMQEFRAQQEWDTEQQKLRNIESKASYGQKYAHMKHQILQQNRQDYEQARAQRQDCLEKKYEIIQENTLRLREKYERQKS